MRAHRKFLKTMAKIERIRFTINDDLSLLRQVVCLNPFEDRSIWKIICENVNKTSGKNFTVRSTREHVAHLAKLFMKEDRANLRRYVIVLTQLPAIFNR